MLALRPDGYRRLLRPLLFKLPPEAAQRAADFALRRRAVWRALAPLMHVNNERLALDFCGLRLENPVGLAAGYDKDCELLPSLAALGFGYLVGGTVTVAPRAGNARPRMLRYVEQQSLINALGFPSKGLEHAAGQLASARIAERRAPVLVSVSGLTVDEIVTCHRRLEPLADAIEVNISSPNTTGLRVFHEPSALKELIGRVNEARSKPLLVKLPPYGAVGQAGDDGEKERKKVMALVRVCVEEGTDAVTVANSKPARDPRLSVGVGGLSGRAIFADTVRMVADVRAEAGPGLAIAACGGIFSSEDAWSAIKAGATTVQLYTGLVYRGPGVVKEINRGLLGLMDREGVASLSAGIGATQPSRPIEPQIRGEA